MAFSNDHVVIITLVTLCCNSWQWTSLTADADAINPSVSLQLCSLLNTSILRGTRLFFYYSWKIDTMLQNNHKVTLDVSTIRIVPSCPSLQILIAHDSLAYLAKLIICTVKHPNDLHNYCISIALTHVQISSASHFCPFYNPCIALMMAMMLQSSVTLDAFTWGSSLLLLLTPWPLI